MCSAELLGEAMSGTARRGVDESFQRGAVQSGQLACPQDMVLIALGGALLSGPLLSCPDHESRCVRGAKEKVTTMLPEMEGSLAASSRPSTSYAVQKPVPSQRHRLAPEQLRSASSAVSILNGIRKDFCIL